jgi:hypothetical protein
VMKIRENPSEKKRSFDRADTYIAKGWGIGGRVLPKEHVPWVIENSTLEMALPVDVIRNMVHNKYNAKY